MRASRLKRAPAAKGSLASSRLSVMRSIATLSPRFQELIGPLRPYERSREPRTPHLGLRRPRRTMRAERQG